MFSSAYKETYSSSGNLFSKTGVGNYAYSSQSITYNAWGKVAEVNETIGSDTYKYELTYGPDLQRVLAVLWKNNSLVHLVTYGDGYEEKYQNGHITYYYYVDGADGNSAVYTSHTQTGDKVYCIDRDHLGSVTALFDQNGNKCFSASFDPWGRRYVTSGSIEYDRGYTGHEHIDELGLIDMNGRMYDPILGRFISVDPYIQNPSNPQNFNRYAYCLNNPVNFTDPSGEFWHIVIGAAVGGIINLAANWGNCDGFWEYCAAFGAGAGAGALTAATGGASTGLAIGSSILGGALTSSTNNLIAQTGNNFSGDIDWGQVGFNGLVGAAAGVVSYGAGSWAVSNLSIPVVNGWSIKSPVLAQGINGTVGGAVGGAAGGFVGGYFMSGFDIEKAGQSALSGLISGAVVGGGFGAAGGYIYAKQNDLNPWTGDHKSYFDGTRYSEKVKAQQSQFDNHSFPNIVDNFESSGKISTKIGNDGLYYRWLEIEGSYRGNEGTFEYIKDMNGVIWHRFFNRSKKL